MLMAAQTMALSLLLYLLVVNSNLEVYAAHLNVTQLIERYGYTSESHIVTTEDDYNIRIDRISGSPLSPKALNKPVVYLQHGLGVSSEIFVIWFPNNSLAFLLADAGYDVWLGNIRGTINGRSHRVLSPDRDRSFWNYDLTTIATRDLTTLIDFVLDTTEQSNLTYVGHSMGTALSYILLSEKPEYNEKVNLVVSLAPVAYWHPKTLGLLRIAMNAGLEILKIIVNASDLNAEVLPYGPYVLKFFDDYCSSSYAELCQKIFNLLGEQTGRPMTREEIRYLLHYAPTGISLKVLGHYMQNINSGKFQKYDYATSEMNYLHYGQAQPPEYNLTNMQSPVILIYVKNDFFAPELSTKILESHLPNLLISEKVSDETFTHADFIFHRNAGAIIHRRVIQLISESLKKTAT